VITAPQNPELVPWWLDHVLVPVGFTLFGAALGFAIGRFGNWLDARRNKHSFLRAIRVELSTVHGHLEGTLKDATDNRAILDRGQKIALHLATNFHTTVFSSQLGKLNDVTDPLVLEVIKIYADLSNLERVKARMLSASENLTTWGSGDPNRLDALAFHYRSTLEQVIRRIEKMLPQLTLLLPRLPE
jgi:hypothetical protein